MANHITSIKVNDLYGSFSLEQVFSPGVNIIYGPNGSGKTTLLHIIANALNGDFERFAFLQFSTIRIELDDASLKLHREKVRDEHSSSTADTITVEFSNWQEPLRLAVPDLEWPDTIAGADNADIWHSGTNRPPRNHLLTTAYLPAYRNVLDAWKSNYLLKKGGKEYHVNIEEANGGATAFTRNWLGPFLPDVSVESLVEVEWRLEIASVNHESQALNQYLESVNCFLNRKRVVVAESPFSLPIPPVQVTFEDGIPSRGLGSLSSGERQIAMILYAATQMKTDNVILIDEPETSLNVDWQRQLLREMMRQVGGKQIIACTHSPVVAADYEDQMMELGYSSAYDEEIPY